MCCWRRVRNDFLVCRHSYTLPEEHIDCGNSLCVHSSFHDPRCTENNGCRQRCQQFRAHPQTYTPQINALCPPCRGITGPGPVYY